ncbi:MAG TPA: hypothetical protein VGF79_09725 [Bacteroidia bacterium]
MKENRNISTEELFREGFAGHEQAFDDKAWSQMVTLLDQDEQFKPLIGIPSVDKTKGTKKRTILKIITIMSTLGILSASLFMLVNNGKDAKINSELPHIGTEQTQPSYEDKVSNSKQTDYNSTSGEPTTNGSKSETITNNGKIKPDGTSNSVKSKQAVSASSQSSVSKSLTTNKNNLTDGASSNDNNSVDESVIEMPKDTVKTVVTEGKTYKVFVHRQWVPEEYEYTETNVIQPVQDGFLGIHFTAERPRGIDTMSAGFNLQFMSGNRIKSNSFGIYGGFDFGVQFYGKGKKSGVTLNTVNQDSGYTHLSSYSIDFFARGHLEYAKFRLIPYINIAAGPRLYSTNQKVASYLPLKDNESSSITNAHTSVSMMAGIGAGLRWRVGKVVSLDFRYEWMTGSPVKLVDMQTSTFNGLNYDLKINKVTPRIEQFKFGVLFDISEREYDKKLIKEGYWKDIAYDSLYVDPKDSNKVYLPCNCSPCPSSRPSEASPTYNDSDDSDNSSSTPRRTNSSSGSSGKGSFPGIRPSSRPTERKAN